MESSHFTRRSSALYRISVRRLSRFQANQLNILEFNFGIVSVMHQQFKIRIQTCLLVRLHSRKNHLFTFFSSRERIYSGVLNLPYKFHLWINWLLTSTVSRETVIYKIFLKSKSQWILSTMGAFERKWDSKVFQCASRSLLLQTVIIKNGSLDVSIM